jgi:hypothetical protein
MLASRIIRGDLPDRQNALQVQRIVAADLDLERGEAPARELPRARPRLVGGADDDGDVGGEGKLRRVTRRRGEQPVQRHATRAGGKVEQGHLQGRQPGMVAGEGRGELPADRRGVVDGAAAQGRGDGLQVGQGGGDGFPGDMGGHRRLAEAAAAVGAPQAQEDVGQFVVLAGGDAERRGQGRAGDGGDGFGDGERCG